MHLMQMSEAVPGLCILNMGIVLLFRNRIFPFLVFVVVVEHLMLFILYFLIFDRNIGTSNSSHVPLLYSLSLGVESVRNGEDFKTAKQKRQPLVTCSQFCHMAQVYSL